jgi:carboxymethylenebutenolidase
MGVAGTKLDLPTDDGVAVVHVARPEGDGVWPGVVMFPDAFGIREASCGMADRLAAMGYVVVLPNMFYRQPAYPPFEPKAVFQGDGSEMARLLKLVESTDDASAMRDFRVFADHLASSPHVRPGKIACVGYCMGGGFALRAACEWPDRVAIAAAFHGGRFVTDPDAPAMIAASLKAPVYLGVAEIDRRHDANVSARLEAAFQSAGVKYTIELYPGASHGFAVPDLPPYDRTSSERHWQRLGELLREV